ncbi:MAG: phosphatidylglycerophosphatase A [Candidatus Dadabacteria bacterium]|nr:phosphatidylglycerophosphatase A [Candidatus Dadabacteria bacterium]
MKQWFIKASSTLFFLGYSPFAPGTAGTLGAALLHYFVLGGLDALGYAAVTVALSAFAVWVSTGAIGIFGGGEPKNDDPREVVIDELCGYVVTMFLIHPTPYTIVAGFFLFRLFDVLKPPPIRLLERLPAGWGIVLDDIAAGVYANIVLQVGIRVL